MGLKKYILSSIILIIIIAAYVFSLEANDYSVIILDSTYTLPIAIWAVLPAVILLLATIFHILFYGFKDMLKNKAIQKDEKSIINLIKDILLENKSKQNFKTQGFKDLSNILNQLDLNVKEDFKSNNEELNSIVSTKEKISLGEYVSLKTMKFNKHSKLVKKNQENKIKHENDYALEVVKKADSFSKEEIKLAFYKILEDKSMTTVKKILSFITLDKEMVLALFEKDKIDAKFSIGLEEIKKYSIKVNFDKNDYIDLLKLYKNTFNPDDLIKMSEELSNENELALDAYFYILIEFEMIDKVRELLTTCADNEFMAYRALMDLRDNGKHYSLDTINYKN